MQTPGWQQRLIGLLDPGPETKVDALLASPAGFLRPGDTVSGHAGFLGEKTSRVVSD